MLLTVIIVASGFVGRYIYTAVPRTADGVELESNEITRQMAAIEAELRDATQPTGKSAGQPVSRVANRHIKGLLKQQRLLRRQLTYLATARRLLALWHAVHIPIGMVLFSAAFVHAAAAIYYATLLR